MPSGTSQFIPYTAMLDGYWTATPFINAGPYHEEDAVTILTHAPAESREFITGFGLTQPGTRAAFKVFVVLDTGNEAGSAAMTVERPG